MTKTIVLTDLIIDYIRIDYENQRAFVNYRMVDNDGVKWESGEAVFWVTMPNEPTSQDFLLPTGYISNLIDLRNDADQIMSNRFLI